MPGAGVSRPPRIVWPPKWPRRGAAGQRYASASRCPGLSLIGLAATETFEQRFETAVTLAAAAEVYAHEEGIVNVYSDETPGREFVDRAREALSPDEVAHATEAGRGLTIKETLDLARTPDTTPV